MNMSDLDIARQFYAEELCAVADLQSEALVRAFAKVPREQFLEPGPWQVFSPGSETDWTTKDADPSRLYHNLLVVIDAERHLNNGCSSFLAFLIDELQSQPGEHVVHILVNAGATHPRSIWLDSLRPDGRLLMPLTVTDDTDRGGEGRVLKVIRQPEGFTASFISGVRIFPCVGGRDAEMNQRLKEAFKRGDAKSVQSLRRDRHEPSDACWLHADNFCLSKLGVADA
jgi:protein-L-isoaspartate O-methyltransferase